MKTLILWIDAFRYDYLSEDVTPFLFSLVTRFGSGSLEPVFGYTSIGASFFTGLSPDKHDQLAIYRYGNKPIRNWLLNFLPPSLGNIYFNLFRYLKQDDNPVYLIPYKYAKHFSLSQNKYYHHPDALPVKTIFDVFRDQGISFLLYNWPLLADSDGTRLTLNTKANDEERTSTFIRLLKKQHDVYILHLWDIDKYGHHYGPGSPELTAKIREQDELIRIIVAEFSLASDNIVIWSDHGMLNVHKHLNIESKLPRFRDGYIYFLDSTMARFWFFNEGKRDEIIRILDDIGYGHRLTDDEKKGFRIDFGHTRYGEEIFVVNPGVLLYPNFFQKQPVKGMHGYDLSDRGEWGFFIVNHKTKPSGTVMDLLPTILQMMHIDVEQGEGQNLLI